MSKKLLIAMSLLSMTTILTGCNNIKSSVSFDTFTTEIKSSLPYAETKITDKTSNIQKVYTTNESGFQSSIIISKSTINSGDSISFANENLKTLRNDLRNKGEITDSETIELNCGDKKIAASMSSIEVTKGSNTRYITQLYFVEQSNGYILSHLTESKSESRAVRNGLEDIHCSLK